MLLSVSDYLALSPAEKAVCFPAISAGNDALHGAIDDDAFEILGATVERHPLGGKVQGPGVIVDID